MGVIKFTVGASTDIDVTIPQITDSINEDTGKDAICFSRGFSIQPIPTGLDGTPLYTVEVRNDPSAPWLEYNNMSTNVNINNGVDDDHFQWLDMRLTIDPADNTTGTSEFLLTWK